MGALIINIRAECRADLAIERTIISMLKGVTTERLFNLGLMKEEQKD